MATGHRLVLRGAKLPDGRVADVLLADGLVSSIADPARSSPPAAGATEIDLYGLVLLPAPAEPHAHLDKALLAQRVPNRTGDLDGAIAAVRSAYASMSVADIEERAVIALAEAVARGATAVRTHVNCGGELGNRGIEALARVRHRLRDEVDLQVVALVESPVTGADGAANRDALRRALATGADLVGGCPAIDTDPSGAVHVLLSAAADASVGLDLHIDETTDPSVLCLLELAEAVMSTGFGGAVTASHCVSLGAQSPKRCAEVAAAVAAAAVNVVTLPQTNLYLQGRGQSQNQLRGLTAIQALRRAGVLVAGGGDNWRDPFNPMGRMDPLETASLLVTAGQLAPEDAYALVSANARAVMGLPPARIEPGDPADLLAIRGTSLPDAIAAGSEHRIVVRAGRVVARTEVRREPPDVVTASLRC